MKKHVAKNIGLSLSLLVLSPGAVSADAVITWNENAAKAATAACLHLSGNGLAESRMYAMVHVAVHDAVNAIDRRSRPYAFDAEVIGPANLDAAVAAAARDVLVSVIEYAAGVAGLPYDRNRRRQLVICCRAGADTGWICEDKRRGGGTSSRGRNRRAAGR